MQNLSNSTNVKVLIRILFPIIRWQFFQNVVAINNIIVQYSCKYLYTTRFLKIPSEI